MSTTKNTHEQNNTSCQSHIQFWIFLSIVCVNKITGSYLEGSRQYSNNYIGDSGFESGQSEIWDLNNSWNL
jgi:hypothetical protein